MGNIHYYLVPYQRQHGGGDSALEHESNSLVLILLSLARPFDCPHNPPPARDKVIVLLKTQAWILKHALSHRPLVSSPAFGNTDHNLFAFQLNKEDNNRLLASPLLVNPPGWLPVWLTLGA